MLVTWSFEDPELCPVTDTHVRMKVHLGALHFIPHDGNKTKIKQVIIIDPCINLPSFVLKHTVSEGAMGLNNLRQLLHDFVKTAEIAPIVE